MKDKLINLMPITILFFILTTMVSLTLLSPAIYQPLETKYVILFLIAIISLVSATVGIVINLVLSKEYKLVAKRKK